MSDNRRRGTVLIAVGLLCLAGVLVGGRVLFTKYFPPMEQFKKGFDPYMVVDPNRPGHYGLVPGFSFTLQGLIQDRTEQGRDLSLAHIREAATQLGYGPNDIVFSIDADGFKGPEIDRTHQHPRLLMLGDSCTFGSVFDRYSYPRVVEQELKHRGPEYEVVNGGVEGYSPFNVLAEMPKYLGLKPDLVTIYIGWNALYRQSLELGTDQKGLESPIKGLFRRANEGFHILVFGKRRYALWQFYKTRVPDRQAPELKILENYRPPVLDEVEKIATQFKTSGAKVALMTLPGIYLMDEEPTATALMKGHLPPYTNNPYVLAKVTERYNIGIRELAKKLDVQLIDLDLWGRTALAPRDATFFDSVHLYEEGQVKLGKFVAEQLFPSGASPGGN